MRVNPVVRDLVLLGVAVSAGWWLRGQGTVVHADRSTSSDGDLGFQMSGIGPDTSLSIYSSASRTLYVYPRVSNGNTHINCEFSFHVGSPGGPIDRQNCGVGEQSR